MKSDELTLHPSQSIERGEKEVVAFSAGGFPEVGGNFDGISTLFRNLSRHSENRSLFAEFYLPAAEMISQPVFGQRRQMVEDVCYQVGKKLAEEKKIDKQLMVKIQNPDVTQVQFRTQAEAFWQSLEGKMAYYKGTVHL